MLPRHATDAVSLVFGTLFAGYAAVWALTATDVIDLDDAWIAGPTILIAAGAVGLATALRPSRPQTAPTAYVPSPPTDQVEDTEPAYDERDLADNVEVDDTAVVEPSDDTKRLDL